EADEVLPAPLPPYRVLTGLVDRFGRTQTFHHEAAGEFSGEITGVTDGAGRHFRLVLTTQAQRAEEARQQAISGGTEPSAFPDTLPGYTEYGRDNGIRLSAVWLTHDPEYPENLPAAPLVRYGWTPRRSLADALQQSGGEDGGSVVFPPVLVQMLDRLESEILADRVSEESRRWLASCGLTVEQMQNQMDPVYTPARKIHLYHCDHRGLPLALISKEGTTEWCAEYDEWGNLLNEENPHQLQQLIRLPGQQYDEESGLYYNRHRYYDPLQGRYITQDPIGLKGGWNLYTYPLSPVNSMDPLGLYEFKSKNIDDIGIFALAMCNGESINENKEYGGLICKKQGEYFPMNPISSNDNDSVDLRNIKCPEGSERVGDYHTHGFYSDDKGNKVTKENDVYDSLNFSSKDLTNSYMNGMGKKEYSSYLGTPNNTYLKYNPKAKGNGVTIIRQGSN
ncbi:RHS repeat-associated core domain-containing protein, partial [Escherichia coli]|nr:RHS repeat-associated core domain-containing protein [Escherichia coli]